MRDSTLAQRLKPKFDGSEFCGAPLLVDWVWASRNIRRRTPVEREPKPSLAGGNVKDENGSSVAEVTTSQEKANEVKHEFENLSSRVATAKLEHDDANSPGEYSPDSAV